MTGFAPALERPRLTAGTAGRILQRKCTACGGQKPAAERCGACDQESRSLKRRSLSPAIEQGAAVQQAPPIVHDVLSSSGEPLGESARALFEPRFGHDFSAVRVHTDSKAAESARAVGADAYTVGGDIVFAASKWNGAASSGLLAHELAHVVQQSGAGTTAGESLIVSDPRDSSETKADATARTVMEGGQAAGLGRSEIGLSRQVPGGSSTGVPAAPTYGVTPIPAPSPPTVAVGHFRNSGDTDPENHARRRALGLEAGMGSNIMEVRGDITGHVASAQYDFKRTKERGIWKKVGAVWTQESHTAAGTDDDATDNDEDLIPENNHIFSNDRPGWPRPLANYSSDANATEVVYKASFIETCNVRLGTGTWAKSSNALEWHSVTWVCKTASGAWQRKPGANEIATGAITVGTGTP